VNVKGEQIEVKALEGRKKMGGVNMMIRGLFVCMSSRKKRFAAAEELRYGCTERGEHDRSEAQPSA